MSKKNLFLFLFVSISVMGFSQTKRETISEVKIGTLSCSYARSIKTETNDTLVYVFLSFQNAESTHTFDIKSVMLPSSDVPGFVKDLKQAHGEMANKVCMNWERERYSLALYNFSKNLYIFSDKKDVVGHTTLTLKKVAELLAWFDSLAL